MFVNIKNTYQEFPKTFWVLMLSTFIDGIGGFMLFPFFALYITDHFGVGVTEVGLIFALFSAGSIVGGIVSGTLTDKYGRKFMLLFGLVVSGISSILMGLIQSLTVFYGMALFMGLISNSGGPAQQAMVTDLLPEENRTEGFGIIRIVGNLAAVIGPALGSLILASQSFMVLFIADAVSSTICAIIVFFVIPETKPEKK
ncbi:MAG: MFS transporter, partial [Promethearchaeota archaeon]